MGTFYNITVNIILEQLSDNVIKDPYEHLADHGINIGDKFNFWRFVTNWYKTNTNLSEEEIDNIIQSKLYGINVSQSKGGNPHFANIVPDKNITVTLIGAKPYNGILDADAVYDGMGNIYFTPNKKMTWAETQQKMLHELMHGIQKNTSVYSLSNLNQQQQARDDNYNIPYRSSAQELDPRLGEVNRAYAEVFNKTIPYGDVEEAKNALIWFMFGNDLPQHYLEASQSLKVVYYAAENKDYLINQLAFRISQLAKNNIPHSSIG